MLLPSAIIYVEASFSQGYFAARQRNGLPEIPVADEDLFKPIARLCPRERQMGGFIFCRRGNMNVWARYRSSVRGVPLVFGEDSRRLEHIATFPALSTH